MSDQQTPTKPTRRGSETRQRTGRFTVRCTPAQRKALAAAADRAGLTFSSYILAACLHAVPPKAASVSRIDRAQLAELLAKLGRLNGNINQIAKALNMHQSPDLSVLQRLPEVLQDLRADLMQTLGKRSASGSPAPPP
ncbi:MAG: hypothetical protein WBK08_15365 [Nitrospira sp.]